MKKYKNNLRLICLSFLLMLSIVIQSAFAAYIKVDCANGYKDAWCIYETDKQGNVLLVTGKDCNGKSYTCKTVQSPTVSPFGGPTSFQMTETQTDVDGIIWTVTLLFNSATTPYQVNVVSNTGISKINYLTLSQ